MLTRRFVRAVLLAGILVQPWVAPAMLRAGDTCAARGRLVQRCYPVAGLAGDEKSLVKLITRMVATRTWSDKGGRGTIDYFPLGMTLVVNQTPDVHEQIAGLLETLRQMQDVDVVCEVRIVSLYEDFCKHIAGDFGIPTKAGPRVTFLNEDQMQKFFEKIQSDARTNVMQAPKMTLLNGQDATIQACETQFFVTRVDVRWDGEQVRSLPINTPVEMGLVMSLQPVVAADGHSVRLHLQAKLTGLASEKVGLSPVTTSVKPVPKSGAGAEPVTFTQFIQTPKVITLSADKVLSIPEGRTAVLSSWMRKREVCKKWALPLLGELPYLGQLYRSEWQEPVCERVLLVVTPRVFTPADYGTWFWNPVQPSNQTYDRIHGGIE
jgi:Flp pilus assembly secretin CpaC